MQKHPFFQVKGLTNIHKCYDLDYDYDLVAVLHTRLQFLHNQLYTKVSLFEISKHYSTSGPGLLLSDVLPHGNS